MADSLSIAAFITNIPSNMTPPPFFGKCHNDKVHKKSMVAENEGILSVHEFNYHSDGAT